MSEFHELCLRTDDSETVELAEEIGWNSESLKFETVFLSEEDWGELKKQILSRRNSADIIIVEGGDEEINRKVAETSEVDILLHPEKGRKDSGMNHVIAESAAENNVAIGFDLKQLAVSQKKRTHVLNHWRHNLKLCEKFDTPYLITTSAGGKYELRAPRELRALINSLGYNGDYAVKKCPAGIVDDVLQEKDENNIRPGVDVQE